MHPFEDDTQTIQRAEKAKHLLAHLSHQSTSVSDPRLSAMVATQYPGVCGPQISKQEAFQIIARVRGQIASEKVKASSATDYEKKARYLLSVMDAMDEPNEVLRWTNSLDCYAGLANSFRSVKAAACWYLRQRLRDLLQQQDRLQRVQEFGVPWLRCVEKIAEMAMVYEAVYGYKRRVPQPLQGFDLPKGESKKVDLKVIKKKYSDWMSLMHAGAVDTKYVDAQRVLEMIGCRPEELEQGVTVIQSGPQTVTFKVTGAKVTHAAGQPWRRITLPISHLPEDWVSRFREGESFVVKIGSKDGLRRSLQRISSRVLPGVPFATAYVYRHAFATMLRDSGYSVEEIGAYMGHSVAETQRLYGFRKGGGRKVKPTQAVGYSVEVPREVRSLKPDGLTSILAKTRARKFKAG